MFNVAQKGTTAVALAALMLLPTIVAARTEDHLGIQDLESSGASRSEQVPLVQGLSDLEIEGIINSSEFSDAIAEPMAKLEVEHHSALGAPLVQCQIDVIATAINSSVARTSNSSQARLGANNVFDYGACERGERRRIRRQRERNVSLYNALASLGAYYNNGTDKEKTVVMLLGNSLLNGPASPLVGHAIGALGNEIGPNVVHASRGERSTAVIAAALTLFQERDFWVISQEIEAKDNSRQSHNAATGIRIILAARARSRK